MTTLTLIRFRASLQRLAGENLAGKNFDKKRPILIGTFGLNYTLQEYGKQTKSERRKIQNSRELFR